MWRWLALAEEFTFQDLIAALQDAVIQANLIAQKAALRNLDEFFDANHNPRTVDVNLPSHTSDSGYVTVAVPVIALVPLASTVLDRLKVGFDVQFSTLMKQALESATPEAVFAQAIRTPERHNLWSLFSRNQEASSANVAHVEIELKGTEPPEALARINDYLLRYLP